MTVFSEILLLSLLAAHGCLGTSESSDPQASDRGVMYIPLDWHFGLPTFWSRLRSAIEGCYIKEGKPRNDWHFVKIEADSATHFTWKNRAGRSWYLTGYQLTNDQSKLDVGSNCPYFGYGYTTAALEWNEPISDTVRVIAGPWGERYRRVPGCDVDDDWEDVIFPEELPEHHQDHRELSSINMEACCNAACDGVCFIINIVDDETLLAPCAAECALECTDLVEQAQFAELWGTIEENEVEEFICNSLTGSISDADSTSAIVFGTFRAGAKSACMFALGACT